jgi:hypothetical protein
MSQSYIEELVILIVVGSILIASKVIACCFSLGLHQKHKSISLRRDSLSIAKLNHLESGRISEEKIQLPITCTCSRNPERNTSFQISPKLELPPCSPVLNIPQKHLVSVNFQTAD